MDFQLQIFRPWDCQCRLYHSRLKQNDKVTGVWGWVPGPQVGTLDSTAQATCRLALWTHHGRSQSQELAALPAPQVAVQALALVLAQALILTPAGELFVVLTKQSPRPAHGREDKDKPIYSLVKDVVFAVTSGKEFLGWERLHQRG